MLGVVHGGFGTVVYWVQASLGLTPGMDVPQNGHLDVRTKEDDTANASAEAKGGVSYLGCPSAKDLYLKRLRVFLCFGWNEAELPLTKSKATTAHTKCLSLCPLRDGARL